MNRESAVFLAAGRAALLQLAHPWVAAALAQHSNLLSRPIGRFHSTFRVIYTMLFGTRTQALEAAKQLYRRHADIRGEIPQNVGAHGKGEHGNGEHYEANEVAALIWVHATLIDSAMLAYEFVLPALSPSDREQYYTESKRMAALFGIPSEALPSDWAAFRDYMTRWFTSPRLSVAPDALALGESVLSGVGTWLRPPHWYHALTAFWMPPRLRAAFGLPFGSAEQEAVDRAGRRLPKLYPYMPPKLRFVGPFHEAQARLCGRSPGLLIRRSNRFWMGQPRLLYSSLSD
ncbi:MAG: oxygenase MpaB family protein [Acidobacteriaceae bacterium]